MKVYLRRRDNVLNVDDLFITSYNIESLLPNTIDMVVWDTEEQAGLKFFSEFAKNEDGFMPPPEEFDAIGIYETAVNHAIGSYDSAQNPTYYYRNVEYVGPDYTERVGFPYQDIAFPKLSGPPAGHTDVVPPNVQMVNDYPSVEVGTKEGRYLQWTGSEFVLAAYDITKTIAEGKTEILNKIKKRLAKAIDNELSIYSQVELIEAADIRALAPAYRSEATIGDVITALDATVATLISDTNSATTHAALRAIDPLS